MQGLKLVGKGPEDGSGCSGIHHGGLEAYYSALLAATPQQLPSVLPNLSAQAYRTVLRPWSEEAVNNG